MAISYKPRLLIAYLLILFTLLTIAYAVDQGNPVSLAASTDSVHRVIRDAYLDVLHREPEEAGLQTYTQYMLQEGKDGAWLHKVLRDSDEGRRLRTRERARAMMFGVALAIVFGITIVALFFRRMLCRLFAFLWGKLSSQHQHYLTGAASLSPVATVFALLYFYTNLKAAPPAGWIICGLVILVIFIAVRTPRWACYLAMLCGIFAFLAWAVFVDANGVQDASSDRDDAVEIAATALLQGSNPWSHRSILDLPITTGPTSILMALPFVGTLGKINGLTFIMWGLFIVILALADIRQRNNTFVTACLLLFFPWFGYLHTLHWSLDELYYPAILSPLLWLAFSRQKAMLAGAVGGAMAFARLSYAPAVIAAGLWWILRSRPRPRSLFCVAVGGLGFVAVVLGLFWMVGGHEFLHSNFWQNSQIGSLRNNGNFFSSSLSFLLEALPKGTLGSTMLVLVLTALAALAMRRLEHPFYHMAVASVLAHTIAFSPGYPRDYQLIFLIPALYGLCFSSCGIMRAGGVEVTTLLEDAQSGRPD